MAVREASKASAPSGSEQHLIQEEESFVLVCFILDVFCSTVDPVSLQEMKMFPAWSSVGTAAFQGAGVLTRSVALQTSGPAEGLLWETEEAFFHS